MSSASSSVTSAPVRLTGRVKWFNNKTGYGFISVVGGNDQYKDASEVFVHHSAVTVSQEQYRYLVEGEYVEFTVVTTDTGDHKFQAGDVRGVKGGKLFCETRHEHRTSHAGAGAERSERGRTQVRGRGSGSGSGTGNATGTGGRARSEWMLVRSDRTQPRGRGRGGRGGARVERHSEHSAPAHAHTQTPTSVPVESTSDVPATPRPTTKKTPRQSKPSSS
jgi:CspA family cold shock protein